MNCAKRGGRRGCVLAVAFSVTLLVQAEVACAAPRTDVVTLINGDRITGEVKGMEQGKLQLKTDAAGTIYIEWDKIANLQTNQFLKIELESGHRLFGQVPTATEPQRMRLVMPDNAEGAEVKLQDVVHIEPIERGGLFNRLDGYVTAGYNYTKANDLQQLTFTGGLNSRAEAHEWSLDGSTTVTAQQGNADSSRWNLSGAFRHFLNGPSFLQAFGSLEGNDELALDLRTTVGGAFGRYLVQTGRQEWAAYAGIDYSRANYVGKATNDALEAVFGTRYYFFRYDRPEASFDATLNLFPSLTQSGRYRAEGNLRSRYELVKDLFFEVSLYGTYDSNPGENAQSHSDYGLVTSLGYTF
ncbi:MAG TPA: DUF481 domain-containing protein [Mycobacterium sp.]|nr:DUF481 domain-containing protein [Mycobacterium sp.]